MDSTDRGTVFSLKQEARSDTCHHVMNLEDTMLSVTSQSPEDKSCVIHVSEGQRGVNSETESRTVGARDWGGVGSQRFTGMGFQFGKMRSSGGGRWGQLHNHTNVLDAAELCAEKWLEW